MRIAKSGASQPCESATVLTHDRHFFGRLQVHLCVSYGARSELVGAAPTAVSQHLAKLRLAGLVEGRREGTFIYYTAGESVRALLTEALRPTEHAATR